MLALRDVTAGYGETVVVRGISLEVPAGRAVALLGRNGVGKTTLLSAVMGLLPVREGQIVLDGRDVSRWPPHRRARAGLGYVPQGRGIFPYLSVFENLLLGLEAARAPGAPRGIAGRGRREADAAEAVLALFPGLRDLLRRPAGTLSGGQQQQLAIARALVSRPRVLLLDEPTEGIQPSVVDGIGDLLLDLKEQGEAAIFLVEQRLDFALRVADYCYILDGGRIAVQGPTRHLDARAVRQHLAV